MNDTEITTHSINGFTVSVRKTALGFLATTEVNGRLTTLTHNHDASEMEPSSNQPAEIQAMREAIRERRLASSEPPPQD